MNNIRTVISLAIAALSLTGCSTLENHALLRTLIKPIQQIRHGSGTEGLYRMARAFHAEGRLAEAITAYRQVLEVDPRHAEAHNALGVIYSQQQQFELAEQQFQVALQIAPTLAHVHNNLGYHLLRQGQLDQALVALGRAHALDRDNKATMANIAAAQQVMERTVMAVAPVITQPHSDKAHVDAAEVRAPHAPTLQLVSVNANTWELKWGARAQAEPAPLDSPVVRNPAPHIEIANGNGVSGLALKISRQLVAHRGFERPRLTNHRPFDVHTTRIQYVAGAEAAARQLNASLPMPVPLIRVAALNKSATVRLLIGKDFSLHRAWAQDNAQV